MTPAAAAALVFLASASVLVLEIVAARVLAPFVGVTLETYTAIIGVMLAGIALGAAWGGRLADRRDPRALIGLLLAAGGGLALLTVPVVLLLGPVLRGGGAAAVVLLTAAGFFPPAVALSAVPPAVVKLRLRDLKETGEVVGRLSAISTAGAILGTFVTGFVLVATVPTRWIILLVGVLLLACGVLLHRWARTRTDQDQLDGSHLRMYAAVGVLGMLMTGISQPPCEIESAYYCAQIVDDGHPTRRTLVLDTLDHSAVDIADPAYLGFHYTRWFAAAIDARFDERQPVRALHIGGGGFTMPRYLRATRPGSFSHVLEIDPALVRLVRERLALRTGPDLRVRVGDARTAVRELAAREPFDVVIGDAFGGLAVPWHLTTKEFTAQIRDRMSARGLYVLNIIDGPPFRFARAETKTVASVFEHVALITTRQRLDARQGGNFVVVASDTPLPLAALWAELSDEADAALLDPREAADWSASGMVLTDDHAPVDQLLGYRF